MPSFSNSLTFNSVGEITFVNSGSEIKVYVGTTELGSINQNYPVTMYTVYSGGVKTLWMKQISTTDYNQGNTNDPNTDTIQLRISLANLGFNIQCCPSNQNRYKTIGWETDSIGQICSGGKGTNGYYDISNPGNFRSMIESVPYGSSSELMMVTRYSSDVNKEYSGSNPVCANLPYCFICLG